MDKISIIVPIYNGQAALERCVNSIVNQSYRNLEIILINDGSTDSSFSMCVDFAHQDQRIKLINQQNAGRNIARNNGMQISTGDFISFMDQDDYLDLNYFEHLHNQIKEYNSDIAICDYKFFNKDTPKELSVMTSDTKNKEMGVYDTNEWMTKLGELYQVIDIPIIVPWAKIIRRSCIKDVFFPNNRSLAEDLKTMWKFYLNAKRISYKTSPDYINEIHPDTIRTYAKMAYGSVKALEEQITLVSSLNIDVSSYYSVYDFYLHQAQSCSLQSGDYDIYQDVTYKINQRKNHKAEANNG